MLKSLCTAALLGVLPLSAMAAAEIGKPAPDFSLTDIAGKSQALSAYRGKPVVLEWTNPGCPFVQKHYDSGNMQKLQTSAVKDGAVWITVNSGAEGKQGSMTPEEAQKITKEQRFAGTSYLLDADGTLGNSYGAKTTPHMFVIDKEGTLVYAGAIDSTPGVKQDEIKGAKNYVAAALAELKAGKPVSVASTQAYGCSVKYK